MGEKNEWGIFGGAHGEGGCPHADLERKDQTIFSSDATCDHLFLSLSSFVTNFLIREKGKS